MDVCMADPGYPVTLTVRAKLRTLVDVLMGDVRLADMLRRGMMVLEGDGELGRRFETLFEFEAGAHSYAGGALEDVQLAVG